MNYLSHYVSLIEKAYNREKPTCYTEKHHVFPLAIFGKNNALVVLTAKEHYVAHHLLWKFYRKEFSIHNWQALKMFWAFSMMSYISKSKFKISARVYSLIYINGKNLSRKHTMETRKKMSVAKLGKPLGKLNLSKEQRAAISERSKALVWSKEYRAKTSAGNLRYRERRTEDEISRDAANLAAARKIRKDAILEKNANKTTKICTNKSCQLEKPLAEFGNKKQNLDGLNSECKECSRASYKIYKQNAKERKKRKQLELGRDCSSWPAPVPKN